MYHTIRQFIQAVFAFFKEFLLYLRSPDPAIKTETWDLKLVLKIAITGLLVLATGVSFQVLLTFIPTEKSFQPLDKETVQMIDSIPNWLYVISAVLLGPIGEELFIRLPLKASLRNIAIATLVGAFTFLFLTKVSVAKWYFQHSIDVRFNRFVPALIILTITIFYYLINHNRNNKRLFGIYFYLLAFIFGVLHRYQQIESPVDVFNAFRETFIQLFSGLYYGYVRMRYGIKLSITAHAIWNGLPALLRVLF